MLNPYENVDFANCLKVPSFNHAHVTSQTVLDNTANAGYTFLPISNYYPSKPFDTTGYTIPSGVIIAPNAEHHEFTFSRYTSGYIHFCSVGSTFESGDVEGGTVVGFNNGWCGTFFKDALAALKYSDGGGITINHVTWSRYNQESSGRLIPDSMLCDMLDYDDRILGIEIYNGSGIRTGADIPWCIDSWDAILKTGRKCWGFCTPDWYISLNLGSKPGRIILLVDEFTEQACLKAIRNGEFYGQEGTTNLAFNSISVSGQTVTVTTANATSISAIIDGVTTSYSGNSATVDVPYTSTYVRFEAVSADDKIYSNAITFRQGKKNLNPQDDFLLLY